MTGTNVLWIRFNGRRQSTGLPDTAQNRKRLQDILDKVHMRYMLDRVDPFRTTAAVGLRDAFKEFLETYGKTKQLKTRQWYEQSFGFFFPKADDDVPLIAKAVEKRIEYCLYEVTKGAGHRSVSPRAKATYLNGILGFLRWCHRKEYLSTMVDSDHLLRYLSTVPRPEPKRFTDAEIAQILAQLRCKGAIEKEAAMVVELAVVTGFRIHELLELHSDQFRDDHIVVTSKDHRRIERFPLWSEARSVVDRIKRNVTADGRLFTFEPGQKGADVVRRRFDVAIKDAGIAKDGRSLHELRKTFISRVCRSGSMPIDVAAKVCRCTVQVMMEHYRAFNVSELSTRLEEMKAVEQRRSDETNLTLS